MGVCGTIKGWCGWVGGAPLGVRRTLRGAPPTQAAAADAVAVAAAAPADGFLKKNKKTGDTQHAKGEKRKPITYVMDDGNEALDEFSDVEEPGTAKRTYKKKHKKPIRRNVERGKPKPIHKAQLGRYCMSSRLNVDQVLRCNWVDE